MATIKIYECKYQKVFLFDLRCFSTNNLLISLSEPTLNYDFAVIATNYAFGFFFIYHHCFEIDLYQLVLNHERFY